MLGVSANKTELVCFLVEEWKQEEYREKLGDKILYVTLLEECWKITAQEANLVPELQSCQEEADTRMLLHAKHAGGSCVFQSDDTDVLILFLAHGHALGKCYLKKGRGSKCRIIDVSQVAQRLKIL